MYIAATGMVCPVGLNAEASCAAIRAGISAFEELPYHDNDGHQPIIGAVVPGLKLDTKFEERLIEMLCNAVSECLNKVPPVPSEELPLLVGLAESGRPGSLPHLAENVIGLLQDHLGIIFHPKWSQVISSGHISGFKALDIADEIIRSRAAPVCLVCGVDSYIRAPSLLWLDQHWRLKRADNSDGVIPGEAAGAVILQPEVSYSIPAIEVAGLGFGLETGSVLSEKPVLGEGLANAGRFALAAARTEMHEIDLRISDVTGESYGFKEQSLALARLLKKRRDELPFWLYAENIGDTGAISGICQLIIAFHALSKNYSPGDLVMCYTSSVSGERAVAIVRRC